jgi:hypothetical protein
MPEIDVSTAARKQSRVAIDDVEHAKAAAGGELIVNEVQAPALVRKRQHRGRRPRANGAATSQPGLTVRPS